MPRGVKRLNGTVRIQNASKERELGNRVRVASSFWSRGLGLMFRGALPPGAGLLIDPGSSIHTMWMRFPIDVLYVDEAGSVVRVDAGMKPWRIGPFFIRCRYVVELPSGAIAASRTEAGDQLRFEPITS